jgi:hypothetical protein
MTSYLQNPAIDAFAATKIFHPAHSASNLAGISLFLRADLPSQWCLLENPGFGDS